MSLNDKQRKFGDEYILDFDAPKACERAGYARESAFSLLSNASVLKYIERRKNEMAAKAELSPLWVLNRWKAIAEADPNEIMSVIVECCRHCYGLNYEYQWTEFDYRQAVAAARMHHCSPKCSEPCVLMVPPLPAGGMGFDPNKEPVESCPACHGEGYAKVRIKDTRKLGKRAKMLYAGVKQTKDGMEIKFHDQMAALLNIAKYLGMIEKPTGTSVNVQVGTMPIEVNDSNDLTDDQLLAEMRRRYALEDGKTIEGESN